MVDSGSPSVHNSNWIQSPVTLHYHSLQYPELVTALLQDGKAVVNYKSSVKEEGVTALMTNIFYSLGRKAILNIISNKYLQLKTNR